MYYRCLGMRYKFLEATLISRVSKSANNETFWNVFSILVKTWNLERIQAILAEYCFFSSSLPTFVEAVLFLCTQPL